MELRAMPWHESIIESELAKTKVLDQRDVDRADVDDDADPGRDAPADLLVLDLIYDRTRLLRDAEAAGARRRRRRADAAPPGRGRVHAVDRPAGAARRDAGASSRGARRGVASAEGEPAGDGRRLASRPAPPNGRTARRRWSRFRFLTAGESHGQALGVTIEGVPAGLAADRGRASPWTSPAASAATAAARARRSSTTAPRSCRGVRHGRTLGSPILLLVRNRDWENWTQVMPVEPLTDDAAAELLAAADDGNKRAMPVTRVRPGHADLAGALKYGFNDVRNVLERASARETTARVAAGGVARAFLRELGIEIWSFTAEVGGVALDPARGDAVARRGRRVAAALPGPGRRGADDRPHRRGAVRTATPSAACSRSSPAASRSGSGRTSTGTAGSTPRWPRP